jgi:hypothetical protein
MNRSAISSEYLEQKKILHQNPNYSDASSLSFAPIISDFILQTIVQSVSDYGTGKKTYCFDYKEIELTRFNTILLPQHLRSMVSQGLRIKFRKSSIE